MYDYQAVRARLEKALFKSAFRQGTSAFRYGLIPGGYSDHLPVEAYFTLPRGGSYSAVSWNMLADEHLYNNFMNVTGTQHVFQALGSPSLSHNIYGGTVTSNKLYYFFSELAQFLVANQQNDSLKINKDLLFQFITDQPSLLARSRDPVKAAALSDLLKASRKDVVTLLLNTAHEDKHEFDLAIAHALELIHHIQKGSLSWTERFKRLKANSTLVQRLQNSDMFALQECTDPQSMLDLLNQGKRHYAMLTHRIHERSQDHCVIIFDESKFRLAGDLIKKSFEGKKPYMLAPMEVIATGQQFMLGSVHHPGGGSNHIPELMRALPCGMPQIVLGDYNHTAEHFSAGLADGMRMVFPENQGSLAGNDYNHLNQAIDGVLTNLSQSAMYVQTVASILPQPPAETRAGLHFAYAGVQQAANTLAKAEVQAVKRSISLKA